MSQAPVEVSADAVRRVVPALQAKADESTNLITQVREQLLEVAGLLADSGNTQVDQLRDEYAELLRLQKEVSLHKMTMADMINNYEPSLDPTNFSKVLQDDLKKRIKAAKFEPESTALMKEFVEAAGLAGEDEDQEVVMEGEGIESLKCPLTQKLVLELQFPVEDDHGYIYEKLVILEHIKKAGGRVKCPFAGTAHFITPNTLRPSERVKREKRRQLIKEATQLGGSSAQAPADDVFDVDDLA